MKTKSIIIVVVVISLFGAMGWTLANNKKEIDSHKEIKVVDNKVAVTVVPAEFKGTGTQLQLVGTAQADKDVVVVSESAGKIVSLNFKMGDYVAKGTVLAEVDDTYKVLAFQNAQLNYDKYKDDYERYQVLQKADAVTENQLRDIRIGFESAVIQLENAKKQLEDTKIRAPFSGYITSQNAELGAFVNVGTPIAGIADIDRLKISLAVSESDAYELYKGQKVAVTTKVYQGIRYQGTISNISPKATASHTYPVEIVINNDKKNPLKAGTYVNVLVNADKDDSALMIPRDAIVSSVKDPSVYVVHEGVARLITINTGRNFSSHLEVVGGIHEGDLIVTNGQINLSDGTKVSIIEN